jgi:hypothetical protein
MARKEVNERKDTERAKRKRGEEEKRKGNTYYSTRTVG